MITFRMMTSEEFPAYRDYFVADYATEIAANFGYTLEKSRSVALNELMTDLPADVATPDHVLLCIELKGEGVIGYLWYKLFDNGETVFILDFMLFDTFRGQGYGKAALIALEAYLLEAGTDQIKLRVAFDNERAFRLYKKIGFSITGYNMVKRLKK